MPSPSQLRAPELIEGLLAGNRLALARAISQVESGSPVGQEILQLLFARTGRAQIVGITGAPGSGKSTLVNALVQSYRRDGQPIAVVAVDPSSPFSGGAVLGDRVRMRSLSGDPGVFIRSMATRGSLGGLSQSSAGVVMLLDAAGFPRILIETVGVGQGEVEIARTAHTTVVVEAPGMGDEIQAIKAGILEIGDLLVVNKADREGADRTVLALQMMLSLEGGPRSVIHHGELMHVEEPAPAHGAWQVPVLKTVAAQGEGIERLREQIEAHGRHLAESGQRALRERVRMAHLIEQIVRAELSRRLLAQLPADRLSAALDAVCGRQTDPYTAARELLVSAGSA